jgi:hypothetical protein
MTKNLPPGEPMRRAHVAPPEAVPSAGLALAAERMLRDVFSKLGRIVLERVAEAAEADAAALAARKANRPMRRLHRRVRSWLRSGAF